MEDRGERSRGDRLGQPCALMDRSGRASRGLPAQTRRALIGILLAAVYATLPEASPIRGEDCCAAEVAASGPLPGDNWRVAAWIWTAQAVVEQLGGGDLAKHRTVTEWPAATTGRSAWGAWGAGARAGCHQPVVNGPETSKPWRLAAFRLVRLRPFGGTGSYGPPDSGRDADASTTNKRQVTADQQRQTEIDSVNA
jgi:hypothetical protein